MYVQMYMAWKEFTTTSTLPPRFLPGCKRKWKWTITNCVPVKQVPVLCSICTCVLESTWHIHKYTQTFIHTYILIVASFANLYSYVTSNFQNEQSDKKIKNSEWTCFSTCIPGFWKFLLLLSAVVHNVHTYTVYIFYIVYYILCVCIWKTLPLWSLHSSSPSMSSCVPAYLCVHMYVLPACVYENFSVLGVETFRALYFIYYALHCAATVGHRNS